MNKQINKQTIKQLNIRLMDLKVIKVISDNTRMTDMCQFFS